MEFPIAEIMFRSPGAVGKLKWSLLIPFKDLCIMIVRILLDTELYVTVKEIAYVIIYYSEMFYEIRKLQF